MLTIGCHLSTTKGYRAMGETALSIGANTFAFFTRNPRGGNAKDLDMDDVAALRELMEQNDFGPLVAHAPYTYNPCSAKERAREFALEAMAEDLRRMEALPGNYYNFHPGAHVGQGPDAGIYGARAAIIGGCSSTSNVLAGKEFGVKVAGTHAHSWVMDFPSEYEAFRAYADVYPDATLLLVDTYDTLKSGIPNAIKVFDELRAKGKKPLGIRIDSGDLAYATKMARKMLDDAGYPDAIICASGDLDERLVQSLKQQGAKINSWGIGTKLITSADMPSLGGVYKLAAVEKDGKLIPKIKVSDNTAKITNPGFKTVYRIYDGATGKAEADLIALRDEKIDFTKPLTVYHPTERWKSTTFTDYTVRELPVKVVENGKSVYDFPKLADISAYAKKDVDTFWDEYKRLDQPHIFKVDLSDGLYALKSDMLKRVRNGEIL